MYSKTTLLFITTFTLISSPAPSVSAAELADDVCKNTTDYAFCHDVVYSNPNAPTADSYFLNSIVFHETFLNTSNNQNYIKSKLRALKSKTGGGNAQVVWGFEKCKKYYAAVDQTLVLAQGSMDSESFEELYELAVDADRNVRRCDESLIRGRKLMRKRNADMIKLANMCLVAAKLYQ